MKAFLIISAFCLISVFGIPQPDQDLKLEDDSVTGNDAATAAIEEKAKKNMTNQGSEPDRTRLLEDLLKKYNKRVNPDDIKLKFGVNLIDFQVREERNVIESYVWLKYSWTDARLQWKPEDYGGVEVLRLDPTAVWKPDVTLYNSADPVNMVNCWDTNTLVYPTGMVLWVPPCKMTSMCKLGDLKRHPYGEQECFFKFGSWTFDGNVLDLEFYNKTQEIDTSESHNSSGFEVVSTTAKKNVRYYSCCPDPYPDLTFNMTIRRLPAAELFRTL